MLNHKKKITGNYSPPGDKSISHRAVILSSQAIGKSQITNLLEGEDVKNTIKVMKALGAKITKVKDKHFIYGLPPGALFQPKKKSRFW